MKNNRIVDENNVIRFRWKNKSFDRKISQLKTAQKYFKKKMHDHIDESSNDVRFLYRYEDYKFYESVQSSNWFEDRLSFEMLSNRYEDRESFRHFELKILSSLRFEFEIFLFDSNK